jgi:hypothetical protein
LPVLGEDLAIWAILAAQLLFFFGFAIRHDLTTRGRVHPAYFWGIGGSVAAVALMKPFSTLPFIVAWAEKLAG